MIDRASCSGADNSPGETPDQRGVGSSRGSCESLAELFKTRETNCPARLSAPAATHRQSLERMDYEGPLRIPKNEKLSADEAEVEARFAAQIQGWLDEVIAEYLARFGNRHRHESSA